MSAVSQLNFGLIGCGSLGGAHAKIISSMPGAKFVAYADTHLYAAKQFLARFGGDYATSQEKRLFDDPSIDAIYICTRHDLHASLCIHAANAGKHILVEKPLALTIESCQEVADAVERNGVHLMPAFKMRYYSLVQRAKAFIPHPHVIVAQMLDARWIDNSWQDPLQGGGNIYSHGCHATDLLRFFSGSEPTRLWAHGGNMTRPTHKYLDQCVAAIEFENGNSAAWIQGASGRGAFTSKLFFGLHFNEKSVQLSNQLKRADFFDGTMSWTEVCEEEEGVYLANKEFISALTEGRPPALTIFDGIQATKTVFAADLAIRTGEVQTLEASLPAVSLIR